MFFKSIRFTLTLWYSVTLAVILVLFCTSIYLVIRQKIYQELDRELLSIAESISSPTLEPFRNTASSVFDQVLEDFIGTKIAGKYVRIVDSTGEAGASSTNLKEFPNLFPKINLRKASRGKVVYATREGPSSGKIRTITFPTVSGGRLILAVQVGTSIHEEQAALDRILLVFCITIPISLLLLGYGGWFLAGRALKPVEQITMSARKITAENLGLRLKVDNPRDEIGRLAETFNHTLARLEDAFTRTRRFSVDVSHELRTPLTILRGDTEVGLKWAKEPDEFRTLLQSNLDEVNRMSDIIEHLLELSRAAEGKLPLIMEEVCIGELLRELAETVRHNADEKRITLSLTGGEMLCVQGDRKRLRQLFAILLDNAVKYTSDGGAVCIAMAEEGGQARVSVRDSGVGIAAEDLSHVFDHFYRVDAARNRAHGGSGLGLSLAKSFAEAHGGNISVESTPGKGSVFTVHLPLSASVSPPSTEMLPRTG